MLRYGQKKMEYHVQYTKLNKDRLYMTNKMRFFINKQINLWDGIAYSVEELWRDMGTGEWCSLRSAIEKIERKKCI